MNQSINITPQQFIELKKNGAFDQSFSMRKSSDGEFQNIDKELRGLPNISAMKEKINELNPETVRCTFFVEQPAADQAVGEALKFLAQKLDFKGDVVKSNKLSKDGKSYWHVAKEPMEPLFGESEDFWE